MKTFLVPIDFSPVTKAVVEEATALARTCQGRIILLHVVQPPVLVAEYGGMIETIVPLMVAAEKAATRLLARWRKDLMDCRIDAKTVQLEGFPATEILRQAEKLKVDFIVMGSHGHTAFYELLIGGTTSGVLKKAACPVIVVPAKSKLARAAKS